MAMREFMDSIYALDESLLDDVETEDVSDEDESRDAVVGYGFSFNFVSQSMTLQVIKNTFFKRMMEPALERLKSGGYVDSWKFEKKKASVLYDTVLDRFAKSSYGRDAKKKYKDTMTFSFCVFFNGSAFGEEALGCTAAALFRAFMASRIFILERGVRLMMKRLDDGNDADEECCVIYETGKWAFYAGTQDCTIDKKMCNLFTGSFISHAARSGMVEPVDAASSRFVVLVFGYLYGKMCLMDASGNVIASYDAQFNEFSTGKFLDNGLLHVKFYNNDYNFMRMDGTLISDKNYDNCEEEFSDGYVLIQNQNDKYNFIDCDGNVLCSEWFDVARNFVDGIAVVWNVDKGETVIDTRGKRVIRSYYDDIEFEFDSMNHKEASRRRIARVRKDFDGDTKCNYIDRTGKLLLKDWIYGDCDAMENGFAILRDKKSKTVNFMREDGSIVSDVWFDRVSGWPEDGVFAFLVDDKWQFMDVERMEPLFGGETFVDVFAEVSDNDSKKYYKAMKKVAKGEMMAKVYGFISSDGTKAAGEMYEYMTYIGNDLFRARHDAFQPDAVMRWGGEVIADGILTCDSVKGGYIRVARRRETKGGPDNEYNYMDTDGNLLSKDMWFDYVATMDNGFVIVSYGDVWDVLTSKGVLLFGKGTVNRIRTVVPDELVIVEKIEGNTLLYNMFDASGKQMLGEWTDFCITTDKDGLVLAGPASYLDYSGNIAGFI